MQKYTKKCEKCKKKFVTTNNEKRFCTRSCAFKGVSLPTKIEDEFTDLISEKTGKPVSRQYIHMLRKNKAGICRLCNRKMVSGGFCLEHLKKKREQARLRVGAVKRNNSLSYRLEKKRRKKVG